jgi:hypothetical protein
VLVFEKLDGFRSDPCEHSLLLLQRLYVEVEGLGVDVESGIRRSSAPINAATGAGS